MPYLPAAGDDPNKSGQVGGRESGQVGSGESLPSEIPSFYLILPARLSPIEVI